MSKFMPEVLRIITRKSPLAMWQAEYVAKQLCALYPKLQVDIKGVVTVGDKILDKSLDKIGGKGLFIKELEVELLNHGADMAVHSLKDVSAVVDPLFQIIPVFEREDPRDVFVANKSQPITTLSSLPLGAVIGTSSARRIAILNKHYSHLKTKLLRGNLHTRISKLDASDEYSGIILAKAGLTRIGLESRITEILDPTIFIPAIGQGSLAIEILSSRATELHGILTPLMHADTEIAVTCEREVGRLLNANCSTPIAVHASIEDEKVTLNAMRATPDLLIYKYATVRGDKSDYCDLARQCAMQL